ncbi:hypothetical protein BDK51DRAFT_33310 [Blyttiomyces helicus]|uniref:Uncharacterized protein n=1 Tax=Blyttiomyces helicus TaxID=388810 RepID=A0A4V1IRV1_9FUNG|nr:hypothetical protein BDK51DRAFT_33310 [Blyttiomyces helicus]|eukprot:RKO91337.1 hypothetical protein BDK51DRAFT_33310 [Blyttiomyces helicus]
MGVPDSTHPKLRRCWKVIDLAQHGPLETSESRWYVGLGTAHDSEGKQQSGGKSRYSSNLKQGEGVLMPATKGGSFCSPWTDGQPAILFGFKCIWQSTFLPYGPLRTPGTVNSSILVLVILNANQTAQDLSIGSGPSQVVKTGNLNEKSTMERHWQFADEGDQEAIHQEGRVGLGIWTGTKHLILAATKKRGRVAKANDQPNAGQQYVVSGEKFGLITLLRQSVKKPTVQIPGKVNTSMMSWNSVEGRRSNFLPMALFHLARPAVSQP